MDHRYDRLPARSTSASELKRVNMLRRQRWIMIASIIFVWTVALTHAQNRMDLTVDSFMKMNLDFESVSVRNRVS